jgi:CheY-like chemotaxis protein
MKVMLVDDSKTMRNIEKSVLGQLGVAEIEEACDGQDALSKVGAFQPDLLLVDWNMPNMDGPRHRGHQGRRQQLRCQAVHPRCSQSAHQRDHVQGSRTLTLERVSAATKTREGRHVRTRPR